MSAFTIRDQFFAMLRSGAYKLTPSARSVYWFLLFHGIWESGHQWYSYADIRMTCRPAIMAGTGLSEMTVRRALKQLEALGFLERKKRYARNGVQLNDSIRLTQPEDWYSCCRVVGEHKCEEVRPNACPPPEEVGDHHDPPGDHFEGVGDHHDPP
jgi:hypothetical protein